MTACLTLCAVLRDLRDDEELYPQPDRKEGEDRLSSVKDLPDVSQHDAAVSGAGAHAFPAALMLGAQAGRGCYPKAAKSDLSADGGF